MASSHPIGSEWRQQTHEVAATVPSPGTGPQSMQPEMSRSLEELQLRIHRKLVERLKPEDILKLPESIRRAEIRSAIERLLDSDRENLNLMERKEILDRLLDDIFGLGPIERLLKDPHITDILVNGANQVYVERHGRLEEVPVQFRDNEHLLEVILRIVARVGRRVDEASPMVDARLPDGSRVNAIIPPLSLRGPTLSIRRFGVRPLRLHDLLERHSVTPEMALVLESAVKARLNLLVSGGTGSGKTTLLNILSAFIPHEERIVTIEDAAELQLQQRHVVQLESRPPNVEGKGEVTIRDLVRNSLRMRPNRIVVGECRGSEALDMLQAMNTGHEGSMTTLHANSPRDALFRLENMLLMTGLEMPLKAIRQQIASAINVIVQVDRMPGGARRITSISELVGLESDVIQLQELFLYKPQGVDPTGKTFGTFEATGVHPHFSPKLKAAGAALDATLFAPRVLMRA
ncbi:MAG TPA: CpaF family protein [Gemmatales bacterium]|nr:CpaF family protein [Gemmatales bacterium]